MLLERRGLAWMGLLVPVFFIGTRLHALSVQLHEGSHYLLHPRKRVNDLIANLLCGVWLLTSVKQYRHTHLAHHQFLQEEADPDKPIYEAVRGKRIRTLLLWGIGEVAGGAVIRRVAQISHLPDKRKLERDEILLLVLMNGLLPALLGFAFAKGLAIYLICWVLPLFTVYPALISFRTVAEHYWFEDACTPPFARTTALGGFAAYLLGAHMEHHFEHHLLPGIPWYRLDEFHVFLKEEGLFEAVNAREFLNAGFQGFWSRLLRSPGS